MNSVPYLNVLLPGGDGAGGSGGAGYRYNINRLSWKGLNRAEYIDSGYLSETENVSMTALPYLIPSGKHNVVKSGYTRPISLFGFDDFLIVIYRDGGAIKLDYIKGVNTYTGVIKESGATEADEVQRSVVKFNVYTTPTDPLSGTYDQKLLIFPDKMSMDFKITASPIALASLGAAYPNIKYATVHLSRLFGVDDGRIYASGFNDYANWALDTADDTSAANAWTSPVQSNVRADGAFTGITTYGGQVLAFKRDYAHEIYNNKNPFRIQDLFANGAIDNRSIQEVNGRLIFVSENKVLMFSGGSAQEVGAFLDIDKWDSAVSGSCGSVYYLYTERDGAKELYTYNVDNKQWSMEAVKSDVVCFAANDTGTYAIFKDGDIALLDSRDYEDHEWTFTTELFTGGTLDAKRTRRIQCLAEFGGASSLSLSLDVDNGRITHQIYNYTRTDDTAEMRCIRIPILRSAAYAHKLTFSGSGFVKLHMLEMLMATSGVSSKDAER